MKRKLKPKSMVVPLRIPEDLHAEVRAISEQEGASDAFIIRKLIRDNIEKYKASLGMGNKKTA